MSEDLSLWEVQWDSLNARHGLRHGLKPAIVRGVLKGAPRLFDDDRSADRRIVIGPERRGRFWTIVFEQTRSGRWRPITGWPSKRSEIRLYQGENID